MDGRSTKGRWMDEKLHLERENALNIFFYYNAYLIQNLVVPLLIFQAQFFRLMFLVKNSLADTSVSNTRKVNKKAFVFYFKTFLPFKRVYD